MITHYDLFAGIGGFSLALEEVFDEPIRHIFCEWDAFPTQVLKKHWPDGEYWGDIAELVKYTNKQYVASRRKRKDGKPEKTRQKTVISRGYDKHLVIVTGGFPCQPFSAAGVRRGTADERYLWPEMYRVIQLTQPEWVIAENVRGLATWESGVVLEQVCADLEASGYEVQPFIIPAVAVNAPHRRDRIWIIGHAEHARRNATQNSESHKKRTDRNTTRPNQSKQSTGSSSIWEEPKRSWNQNWPEVAAELCLVDDGLSSQLVRLPDGTEISYSKWRKESLKAGGNAIVPQVAVEIFKAIKAQLASEEE